MAEGPQRIERAHWQLVSGTLAPGATDAFSRRPLSRLPPARYRDVIIRVIDADRGEWGAAVVTRWSLGWSHAADSENEVRNYHCSSIS